MGYAHIQLWPDKRSALRIIVIDEDSRNQGIGSQFLEHIEHFLKQQGVAKLHVEAHPDALQFYQKNSYTPMPFNDPENHESHPQDVALGKIL